jgi:glycosyltransferase involved in cell wall biosynthesis
VPEDRPYPIAFLLTSFDVGGTERQMVELIRRLDRSEFEVHLAVLHRRGALETHATRDVASVAEFPIAGFGRPSALRQLAAFARWCRRIRARIVHTVDLYSNILGLPGAALAGVPVRIGNRRELASTIGRRGRIAAQRLAYKSAHAVVANAKAAVEQLRSERVPDHKIHIIPNGVNCDAFAVHNREASVGPRRVITVANLRPEKGHDTLIAAASTIVQHYSNVEFHIVGDGPCRAALEQQVRDRGLAPRFHFLGERSDIPGLLAESDVFVLPSRSEACPNSVLEAMATGLPVVASRVGGVPELIDSGVNGILITPDAPDALAAATLSILNRPAYAATLGRAAREKAARRFSFDRMVSSFEGLYLSKLDKREVSREPDAELAAS